MDWEAPNHAGSEPEYRVPPAAGPAGASVAGQDFLPAWPRSAADEFSPDQDEFSADQDEPASASEAGHGLHAGAEDQRRARHSVTWPRLAWPRLARPRLARPRLTWPLPRRQHRTPQPGTPRTTARPQLASLPLVSRPLLNPRLAADPRVRIWATRTAITVCVYLGFMLWHGWRLGITFAALYTAADIIFRSKTTAVIPPAIMVTAAQRSTRRRLKVLQPAGYLALNACTIPGRQPGTQSIIDHVVVGPAGVFVLDSERWDRRLPVRTIGGKLYHGPVNQEERLKHSRWEAHQAATLISAELGQQVKVHPAMIIYGPKIPWVVSRLEGVDVFDGGRVSTFFRRQSKATARRHLDPSQIGKIYAAAAQALPPMP